MSNTFLFVTLLLLIQLIYSGKIIKYNITPKKLLEEECDPNTSSYLFIIKCDIKPGPIYDLEFDLNLSSPKNTKAKCFLMDDVVNEIKCIIDTLTCPIQKTNIEIVNEQIININDGVNNVTVTFSKSKLNIISKVTCKSYYLFSNIYFIVFISLIFSLL